MSNNENTVIMKPDTLILQPIIKLKIKGPPGEKQNSEISNCKKSQVKPKTKTKSRHAQWLIFR